MGQPHLLLLEAVSMSRESSDSTLCQPVAQSSLLPWYHTVTACFLPNLHLLSHSASQPASPTRRHTHSISTHVATFQGSLTTEPSLILALQADGIIKEPGRTSKGPFAITALRVSAMGGTSWDADVDSDRESSSGSGSAPSPCCSPTPKPQGEI